MMKHYASIIVKQIATKRMKENEKLNRFFANIVIECKTIKEEM